METIKARLAAGKNVNVFVLTAMPHPAWIELASLHGGFHAIWIDQEHAATSQERIEHLVLACKACQLDSFVRLAPTDYATVMRPLEAGVGGVMVAQIQDSQHARTVVSWAKFPPMGKRGVNTNNREGAYSRVDLAEFLPRTNRNSWLALQIETLTALEDVDEIVALDGVDHLFVGPADLSTALGVPGDFLHDRCKAALERVSRAAAKAGKTWGVLTRGGEHADFCQSLGCKLFAVASEFSVAHAGFRSIAQSYPNLFSS